MIDGATLEKNLLYLSSNSLVQTLDYFDRERAERERWLPTAVLTATHCFELALKAKIVKTHPLLIFSELDKVGGKKQLEPVDFYLNAKTYQLSALPNVYFATFGDKIDGIEEFEKFVKFRNSVQHLGIPPEQDIEAELAAFLCKTVEPFLSTHYQINLLDRRQEIEDKINLISELVIHRQKFVVPDNLGITISDLDIKLSEIPNRYLEWLKRGFQTLP